jgi:enoyl-CoA hydratase
MPSIEYAKDPDGIVVVTLNRPSSRNALTWEAMEAFAAALETAHAQDDLRALIVTGAGSAFCSGGDLFELDNHSTRGDGVRLARLMGDALDRLEALPVPTLAAIEGPALGGGAEITLACDLRVVAEGASLGMMHVRLGITPAWGGGQRLLRLVGYARAFEWLTAGRVLNAAECERFGLANLSTPRGRALSAARQLAEAIAGHDPAAVRAVKRFLRAGLLDPAGAAALERDSFPDLWAAPAHLEASARFVLSRNHRPARR